MPKNKVFALSSLAVAAVIVVLGVVYVNGANGSTRQASATPSVSAMATSSASASGPNASPCATAQFGAPLEPLNAPANIHVYSAAPPMTIDTAKLYRATIHTAQGDIVLCLQPALAPNTVNNFVTLARNHFYDGLTFHRVCPNPADQSCSGSIGIIQGGDPKGDGNGGPGYQFKDEPVQGKYVAGTIAMANSGPNTNGSQFFIDTTDNGFPLSYNLFGNVESGLDVASRIAKGDIMETVTVAEQK